MKSLEKKIRQMIISEINDKEQAPKSYTQKVKDWIRSNGMRVDIGPKIFTVWDDNGKVLHKTTNSFFRSAHLQSFVNQICKIKNIPNDFDPYVKSTKNTDLIKKVMLEYKTKLMQLKKSFHDELSSEISESESNGYFRKLIGSLNF